ncbi:MAG: SRPBCC family protein [Gemmatimonadota bacterium]|jgi:carbon monoxide dehydrogenase subunit G
MKRQTATILIDRPPVEVFRYMDDVSREREWQPNLRAAEQEPPGPSKPGTCKRYVSEFMGREIRNTYVVREVQSGRRIVTETTPESAIDARCEIVIEPEGAGARVTLAVEGRPRGFLRLLGKGLLERAYHKELSASLARLKARMEAT